MWFGAVQVAWVGDLLQVLTEFSFWCGDVVWDSFGAAGCSAWQTVFVCLGLTVGMWFGRLLIVRLVVFWSTSWIWLDAVIWLVYCGLTLGLWFADGLVVCSLIVMCETVYCLFCLFGLVGFVVLVLGWGLVCFLIWGGCLWYGLFLFGLVIWYCD